MTLDEFKDVARLINAMYGTGEKVIFDTVAKVTAWYSCLSDLEYSAVAAAVKNHAMRCKFAPSIAEIREECVNITTAPLLDEHEAWLMVRDAIRNGIYGSDEEFHKFPDEVKAAVVSPATLSDWAYLNSSEIDTVIQSQFKRQYRACIDRIHKETVLGAIGTKQGAMAGIAENVAARLGVNNE